jgi:1,4-dihydroxy-2-naphthoyl-CoA hydrolase
MIFKQLTSIEELNSNGKNTIGSLIGIEFTEIGEDYLCAKMPVDHRTHQPFGILHGGASVVLAETLGSVAGNLSVDAATYHCVGLDINANHIRSVRQGWVYGKTTPLHIGKTTQVWEIKIVDERDKLVCISRLTLAVVKKVPA